MNYDAYAKKKRELKKIRTLLSKAGALYDEMIRDCQEFDRILLDYHNEEHSLKHCLRWGEQAANDLVEDWADIVKEAKKKAGE